MPKTLSISMLILICVLSFGGCGKSNFTGKDYPLIYDAWNARYQYNPITREMQSVVDDRTLGRAWSRDEFGRLNSMYFYSGVNGRDENLLYIHKRKLDKERDQKWESDIESRHKQIDANLLRDSNESKQVESTEIANDEVAEEIDAFIPISTIDSELPSEFVPNDLSTESNEPVPDMAEPSPFSPLPPLP